MEFELMNLWEVRAETPFAIWKHWTIFSYILRNLIMEIVWPIQSNKKYWAKKRLQNYYATSERHQLKSNKEFSKTLEPYFIIIEFKESIVWFEMHSFLLSACEKNGVGKCYSWKRWILFSFYLYSQMVQMKEIRPFSWNILNKAVE